MRIVTIHNNLAGGARPSKAPGRDVLSAGPLQRLAGGGALLGLIALALLVWWGRGVLPALLTPRVGLLLLGLALALALLLTTGFLLLLVAPALNGSAAALAETAEAVASGDLTLQVTGAHGAGQLNRVWRAVGRMLASLRRLALALRAASHDAAALASQITAGADTVASRAAETARTSLTLSQEAATMAGTIDALASDAERLTDIAADVAMGAHEALLRNGQLRALTAVSRERLDHGSRALGRLGEEIRESAESVEALALASEEIRSFVALVQKMAKQSKLLALNAAMEAARAGEQGDGFAVVAAEVRRLATDSTQAAKRSEAAVAAILERVEHSRTLTGRAVETVGAVLDATRAGDAAAAAVEAAVLSSEEWNGSVEQAAGQTSRLVSEMTERLDALARGTQGFVVAMRQVAATSEEQRASTREIADAASSLSDAARRLAELVETFRLDEAGERLAAARRSDGARYRASRPTPAIVAAMR
ncbi:MAG TPA: methyl-accepting chemotaxis protein [Gemmatimonadaceae bacterium]|nr:methyl-accepting chemotaxis protein [Gemmatimonadaceae bacterium]